MEAEIARGKNPYADLITLSKGNDWKVQMGIGGNDAVTAKAAVEGANGANGVPWIGGPAGGIGQEPIRMTSDVVEAGYNVLLNRAIDAEAPAPATAASRLADLWPDPAAAATWTREVIGDTIARTCEDCGQQTVSGKGLLPKLQEESEFVAESLADLVTGNQPLTLVNLDAIAAPGIAISRQVIEAIRDMPATEQGLIMDRLTAEIATARTVEKALLARRMLISGNQVPEVFAMQVASDRVDEATGELDREIDNLLFESRVRREIVSTTVSVLLKRAAARRQASLDVPEVPVIDPNPIENGRITPE
jgi:integrating conjugative element protein (TIGR03755 family)